MVADPSPALQIGVVSLSFEGLLFDMDGTLVDSTEGVEGAWNSFAETYPSLDVQRILQIAHGVRTEDNLRRFLPELSEEQIQTEAQRFELEIVRTSEKKKALTGQTNSGIRTCPGVPENILPVLRSAVQDSSVKQNWAICTSATRDYASKALDLAAVPVPQAFVTANDIANGKPAPDPYLKGADAIGINPSKCLVFEDAPAGIMSGRSAGCTVLALLTTHSEKSVLAANPHYLVKDLSEILLERDGASWRVTLPSSSFVTV